MASLGSKWQRPAEKKRFSDHSLLGRALRILWCFAPLYCLILGAFLQLRLLELSHAKAKIGDPSRQTREETNSGKRSYKIRPCLLASFALFSARRNLGGRKWGCLHISQSSRDCPRGDRGVRCRSAGRLASRAEGSS